MRSVDQPLASNRPSSDEISGPPAMGVPVLDRNELQGVFVVIPAFNEQKVIRQTVSGVLAQGVRVVVVDDGSTDDTLRQLRDLPCTVLSHLVNLGQGAALQTGIDCSLRKGATTLVTFDSDGQHDPEDIPRLIRCLEDKEVDVILGSRFLGRARGISRSRWWLLRAAILFTSLRSGIRFSDAHNGLRAFRSNVARQLRITQNRMAHASEFIEKMGAAKLKFA